MVVVLSLASLVSGGALASVAKRHPAYLVALERSAGVLTVTGLALLGASLPFIP
jgi:hypothetical protein